MSAGLMAVTATSLTKTGLTLAPHLHPSISLFPNLPQLLLTTRSNSARDYNSSDVSSESIRGARLSACGIDGSHELLAGEESNIGAARIEDLQQE